MPSNSAWAVGEKKRGSSWTLLSKPSATEKASRAVSQSLAPLPRTRPMYIQACASRFGLQSFPHTAIASSSAPSAFSASLVLAYSSMAAFRERLAAASFAPAQALGAQERSSNRLRQQPRQAD